MSTLLAKPESLGLLLVVLLSLQHRPAVAAVQCHDLFDPVGSQVAWLLEQFDFPHEADAKTTNPRLRQAIYQVFEGRDFYTGQPIPFDMMSVDHVVPKSRGGKNNIYNYVPTLLSLNQLKAAQFDQKASLAVLSLLRTVYAPKVTELFEKLSQEPSELLGAKDFHQTNDSQLGKGNFKLQEKTIRLAAKSKRLVDLSETLARMIQQQPDLVKSYGSDKIYILVNKPELVQQLPPLKAIRQAAKDSVVVISLHSRGDHVQERSDSQLIYEVARRQLDKSPESEWVRFTISKEYLELLRLPQEEVRRLLESRILTFEIFESE